MNTMEKRRNNWGKRIIAAALIVMTFAAGITRASFVRAKAADKEAVVRVAYFDLGEYYQAEPDGYVKSYDSAYLDMVSKYTGLNFEYVDCGTWDNALRKLEKHEVDLVGTMQWTSEREEQYEICDASYGYTVAELAALDSSDFIYEDYDRMNGATVGYIGGYVIESKVKKLMTDKDISFRIKTYDNQTELDNALENGEIDLIAANAHAVHGNWKTVEKFGYAPFYFASWKGNDELIDTISQAIIQIYIHQPDFDDNLIKEFFPIMVNSPYNKEEIDCINEGKTYTVYFDTNTEPIVWYDKNEKEMRGVLADICTELAGTTGLKFQIKPRSETPNILTDTDVTYRTVYYATGKDASKEVDVTNSILDQTFKMYHRFEMEYNPNGSYEISVVKNRDGIKAYLQDQYPNCKIKEMDSPEECIESVERQKSDLAFLNSHVAESAMVKNGISDITAVPVSEIVLGVALEFHGEDAPLAAEIVDKGIQLIDQNNINDAMLKYSLEVTPKMTLTYLVRRHLGLFVFCCGALAVIIITIVVLVVYAKVMKREKNRMEEINCERTDFFARMSHDMRTPMNGILGMLELTDETNDLEEIRSNNKKAILSGKYMLSLINDTLDLQKLESKKLTLEAHPVRVGDFVENIFGLVRTSAQQKNIDFVEECDNVEPDNFISIDQVRVKQIFVNILSNAIKFTPENGIIKTTVKCVSRDEKSCKISVSISDNGVGMTAEFIEKSLFKPYSQEYNKVTGSQAGSGLGLAIVKNLVELMGGSIKVVSEVDEGSTFTVELDLPYADEGEVKKLAQSKKLDLKAAKRRLAGRRILVCEDHPLNAEITQRLLEKVSCEVAVAGDGKQGLEIFAASEENSFDAILMDIRMPVMDGLEAAKAIRALSREDAKTIPIIAMTANAYDSDKENCRQAGMNEHISKPVDVSELYYALDQSIKNKG